MVEEAEYHPLAADAAGASHSSADLTIMEFVYCILLSGVILGIGGVAFFWLPAYFNDTEPRLFIRLVEVQGLDPCVAVTEVGSPILELAVEVDQVSESKQGPCAGGEDAMLRVSYRGIILTWGSVPRFCIDGRWLRQGASSSVATVVAKAEGSVVREEIRNLIWADQRAFGKAELDVDGEIPGLGGHLYCKTYLFEDEPTEGPPPCWVQKKLEEDSW